MPATVKPHSPPPKPKPEPESQEPQESQEPTKPKGSLEMQQRRARLETFKNPKLAEESRIHSAAGAVVYNIVSSVLAPEQATTACEQLRRDGKAMRRATDQLVHLIRLIISEDAVRICWDDIEQIAEMNVDYWIDQHEQTHHES